MRCVRSGTQKVTHLRTNALRASASAALGIGGVKLILNVLPNGQVEGLLCMVVGVLLWILVELRERNRNEE